MNADGLNELPAGRPGVSSQKLDLRCSREVTGHGVPHCRPSKG
jgi:hypothetical protein